MDRYQLLCESCGYALRDLEHDANCPECGRSVAGSLPQRRPGSAFQQAPGLVSWARTNYSTLRHPGSTFERLRIGDRVMTTRSTRLLLINTLVASFLLVDPWVGVLIFDPARGARALGPVLQVVVRGGMLLLETGLVMLFLLALTYLELLGVRFFARQRSWRLTPEASWQVVCHASAGWIVFGLLPLLGMAALYAMVRGFRYVPQGTIDLTAYVPTLPAISVHSLVTGLLTLGGALLGLLVFETLVFIGVRRCKFATTLRSEAPRPVANVPPRA